MNPVKIWQVVTKHFILQRNAFYQKYHSKTRMGYPFLKSAPLFIEVYRGKNFARCIHSILFALTRKDIIRKYRRKCYMKLVKNTILLKDLI